MNVLIFRVAIQSYLQKQSSANQTDHLMDIFFPNLSKIECKYVVNLLPGLKIFDIDTLSYYDLIIEMLDLINELCKKSL